MAHCALPRSTLRGVPRSVVEGDAEAGSDFSAEEFLSQRPEWDSSLLASAATPS